MLSQEQQLQIAYNLNMKLFHHSGTVWHAGAHTVHMPAGAYSAVGAQNVSA